MKPIDFIGMLRNSDPYISAIYTNGGCYQFYLILKRMYPYKNTEPYINLELDHIVTKIDGVFYDINGINNDDFVPIMEEMKGQVEKWSFANQRMLQIGECSFCEDPIVV